MRRFICVKAPIFRRFYRSGLHTAILLCGCITITAMLCFGCGRHSDTGGSGGNAEKWPEAAVSYINFESVSSAPTYMYIGENRVFSCREEYDEDREMYVAYFDIIDIKQNCVEISDSIDNGYIEPVRSFYDGTVLLYDYYSEYYILMDDRLQWSKIETPVTGGQFSYDRSTYYYAQDEMLYEMKVSDGTIRRIPLPDGLCVDSIISMHPTKNYISCFVYTSLYSEDSCGAVIDCDSGEVILLRREIDQPYFYNDNFQCRWFDYDGTESYLVWGELTGDSPLYGVNISYMETEDSLYERISGSNYSVFINWMADDSDSGSEGEATCLYRMDNDKFTVCHLSDYGVNNALIRTIYLSEEKLILGCVYQEDTDTYKTILLDPDLMEFADSGIEVQSDFSKKVDEDIINECSAELIPSELVPELEEARELADDISERFDVSILLSNQCTAPCSMLDYNITTTDNCDFDDESDVIISSLKILEDVLNEYPDGYFSQFRTESDESGLYFMPIGAIENNEPDSWPVAAFQFDIRVREYIAFNCTEYDIEANLHHEIWHATEYKINSSGCDLFYSDEWDMCNPDGFEYLYSYNMSDTGEDIWKWTYFSEDSDVYFVDDYSKTNPREDRARIMEYMMCYSDVAEELAEYPIIQQKFEIMCRGIREAFDTDDWEMPVWEKFLKK